MKSQDITITSLGKTKQIRNVRQNQQNVLMLLSYVKNVTEFKGFGKIIKKGNKYGI